MTMNYTPEPASTPDVMQVCRSGHVITDLLHGYPDRGLSRCDRCGAPTVDRCLTCGLPIPGAVYVPGLVPAGSRPPPSYCTGCGAPFPWTNKPRLSHSDPASKLERLLRRLPAMIRELRWRQDDGPPITIQDDRDLADLLRAVLSLEFDGIRLEHRTPLRGPPKRTDFLLSQRIVVTARLIGPNLRELDIPDRLAEDRAYYRGNKCCTLLVALLYDLEGALREPPVLERAWSSCDEDPEMRCIIAGS
jgi:hypothetical protein